MKRMTRILSILMAAIMALTMISTAFAATTESVTIDTSKEASLTVYKLNGDVILSIMSEQKPNQHEKISFRADKLRQFIPNSVPPNKTEEYVFKALDYYRRVQERMRDNSMER